MFKGKSKIKKSIVNNISNEPVNPTVVNIQKSRNDPMEDVFEVEVSCVIDSKEYLGNNIQKIDVEIDNSSIKKSAPRSFLDAEKNIGSKTSDIYQKDKSNPIDIEKIKEKEKARSYGSKNFSVSPKLLNASIEKASLNKKKMSSSVKKTAKTVGKINFSPATGKLNILKYASTQKELFQEDKKLSIKIVNKKRPEVINTDTKDNFRDAFKRNYNRNNISIGKDSASLFQESHNKTSFKKKNSGNIPSKSGERNKNKQLFDLAFNGIKKEILNEPSNVNIEIESKKSESKNKKVKTKIKVSRKDLLSGKSDASLIFNVNNRKNQSVQKINQKIRVNDILKQDKKEETDFNLGVKRTKKGSQVSIGKSKKNDTSLSLLVKNVKQSSLPNKEMFKKAKDISLSNAPTKSKDNKKLSSDVFYRGTLNFNGNDYSNLKCIVDRAPIRENQNIPLLNITGEIIEEARGIRLYITDISSNVDAVRVVKQKFVGNVLKKEYLPILDEKGREVNFKFIEDENNLILTDYDVFEERSYLYKVECIMRNGEKKLAFKTFLEKFEEKSEVVLIENVSANIVGSKTEVSFKVRKIETDVEVILNNLYGNLFDLFQKEMEKVKNLSGIVYSIEVVRIDKHNSTAKTVARVSVDQNGEGKFVDDISDHKGIFYKFTPRVVPAADIITSINDKISLIGQQQVFNKLNFNYAAKIKSKEVSFNANTNNKDLIVGTESNKYNSRNSFLRGRINTPEKEIEDSGFNFFKHSSTGDIKYFNFNNDNNKVSFELSGAVINEIDHFGSKVKNNEKKKIQKQLFSLDIKAKDDLDVDFYKMYVKENDDVYLDGVFNSTDENGNKNYKYLIEQEGSYGKVDYYVVPVFKDGSIGKVKNVGTKIIQ